jgi:D-serine dehydratase
MNFLKYLDSNETFFLNKPNNDVIGNEHMGGIYEANDLLNRFIPYFKKEFNLTDGLIESPLLDISNYRQSKDKENNVFHSGKYFAKLDSHLPIAGSIKARGGIYEVLKYTEKTLNELGLLNLDDDYSKISTEEIKKVLSNKTIVVGSTGNLGLSIGIMSSKLGFKVEVHMSRDAKEWKKELLRSKGVKVFEYDNDYSYAVLMARKSSQSGDKYFIDDENSKDLFYGYGVAGLRLKEQLHFHNINFEGNNKIFVYLPCGVGGAPGGIAYSLKSIFGDNVHLFFVEPTQSPCMLAGILSKKYEKASVYDYGLTNKTIADGLAVASPSGFVSRLMENTLNGLFTVNDENMRKYTKDFYHSTSKKIEPSAASSLHGPFSNDIKIYMSENNINPYKVTHISWMTGGSLLDKNEFRLIIRE